MFDTSVMAALSSDVTAALATLRTRWGTVAPTRFGDVVGALATVPLDDGSADADDRGSLEPDRSKVHSTGFAALDAILGPGGVPRGMGVSLRGELSSGRTTLALRLVAAAQQSGSIVAWLDLAAAFDPVEAVARGIQPEWLVVVTPETADEGIVIAGSLLSGRTVDVLVIDLPPRIDRSAAVADRLGRLAALARRAGITVVVLEPPGLISNLAGAVGEATGIRLELARQSWIRLGRDVVGQQLEVVVGRNRAGPPGKRASLRILYADGGERDRCLRRDDLLDGAPPVPGIRTDATPPLLPTAPPPRSRAGAPVLRLVAGGPGRPGREAVDRRAGARRRSGGEGSRRQARDATGLRPSAVAGGDVPRARPGG
jgi:recombination protein RecA